MKFAIGDKVKTLPNPFDKNGVVRFGVVSYIHAKDRHAPYIVDFGDDWAGFGEDQIALEK